MFSLWGSGCIVWREGKLKVCTFIQESYAHEMGRGQTSSEKNFTGVLGSRRGSAKLSRRSQSLECAEQFACLNRKQRDILHGTVRGWYSPEVGWSAIVAPGPSPNREQALYMISSLPDATPVVLTADGRVGRPESMPEGQKFVISFDDL